MSKVIGDKLYVSPQKADVCEYCGKIAELRPYGKNGANICFECAMKDEETTKQMFAKRIEDVKHVIIGDPETFN